MRRVTIAFLTAGVTVLALTIYTFHTVKSHVSSSRKNAEIAWIADQLDVTKDEKEFWGRQVSTEDRNEFLKSISDWRACAAHYSSGGDQRADLDFDNGTGKIIYISHGGAIPGRYVPGFYDCQVPLGNANNQFQELDLRGAVMEDASINLSITEKCQHGAINYAQQYNKELTRLRPKALRECSGTPSQLRKIQLSIDRLTH